MEKSDKITIIDVARRAGVSKGTVDRVLHDRGEVSERSARRVRKAIADLGYRPNLYASLLATRRHMVIACLLPSPEKGEYWDLIRLGCLKGSERAAALNVSVEIFFYDQYDVESFREAGERMLASDPIGVVLPPLFKADTLELSAKLYRRRIPYVYIDSRVEDNHYLAYFGMPPYNSGVLVAALLTERCSPESVDDILVVRLRRDKSGLSDPTVDRRAGFTDYITEHFPDSRIHNVFIDPSSPGDTISVLEDYWAAHPDNKFVTVFNSRVHLLAAFLRSHPDPRRRVIGYDNLEKNLEAVRDGDVTVLIGQHTEEYVAQAVSCLVDWCLKRQAPSERDNYVHMDILTRYNI